MRKTIWLYGLLAAALIFAVRFFEQRSLTGQISFKAYAAMVGVLFLALGVWVGWKFFKSPPDVAAAPISSNFSTLQPSATTLTDREAEILACISEGLSNRDIAARLFVSENTVKKHVQNIFAKLEVGNRVHALAKARALGWIV